MHIPVGDFIGRPSIVTLLHDEARRKPVIADLINRAPKMTDTEFEAVITQLPWQKKALGMIREAAVRAERDSIATDAAEAFAALMGPVTTIEPERGYIMRHVGPETTVKPPRGMPLSLATGDLLFITKSMTWLGSIPIGFPDVPCELITKDAQRSSYFEMLDKASPAQHHTPATAGEDRQGLFRIIRHS